MIHATEPMLDIDGYLRDWVRDTSKRILVQYTITVWIPGYGWDTFSGLDTYVDQSTLQELWDIAATGVPSLCEVTG